MSLFPDGIFITLEGIEGAGKSTAVKWIADYLTKLKKGFNLTREPGGTALAEDIRKWVLSPVKDEPLAPETELLLMFAARAQHLKQIILPALAQGKWVICDRFVDASFAYQGGGRGINIARVQYLEDWLVKSIKPTCTILLDLPVEIGLSRANRRGAADRIEQEKVEFHQRVRQVYLDRASADKTRFRLIDAGLPLPTIQNVLEQIINEFL